MTSRARTLLDALSQPIGLFQGIRRLDIADVFHAPDQQHAGILQMEEIEGKILLISSAF